MLLIYNSLKLNSDEKNQSDPLEDTYMLKILKSN